jgi:hypothetical protein
VAQGPLSPRTAEPFPGLLCISPEKKVQFHGISHFRHRAEARKIGPEEKLNSRSIAISTVFSTGVENFGKRPNAHPVSAGASEEFLPAPTEKPGRGRRRISTEVGGEILKDADFNTNHTPLTPLHFRL